MIPTAAFSSLPQILFGAWILLFGRSIFWLVIAVLGFLLAYQAMRLHAGGGNNPAALLLGLIAGAAGAVVAVYFSRFAIGVLGFMGGGYLLSFFALSMPGRLERFGGPLFLLGGLAGFALLFLYADELLTVFTSLIGATVILRSLRLRNPLLQLMIWSSLVILGVAFQDYWMTQHAATQGGRLT